MPPHLPFFRVSLIFKEGLSKPERGRGPPSSSKEPVTCKTVYTQCCDRDFHHSNPFNVGRSSLKPHYYSKAQHAGKWPAHRSVCPPKAVFWAPQGDVFVVFPYSVVFTLILIFWKSLFSLPILDLWQSQGIRIYFLGTIRKV